MVYEYIIHVYRVDSRGGGNPPPIFFFFWGGVKIFFLAYIIHNFTTFFGEGQKTFQPRPPGAPMHMGEHMGLGPFHHQWSM
jgi:hypothetical protein